MRTRNPLPLLLLLLTALLTAPLARADDAAQATDPQEYWFVLTLGGERAGYVHSLYEQVDDTLVTSSQTQITIRRGQAVMQITQASRFVETLNHQPVSSSTSMNMGAMVQTQELDFTTSPWTLTTTTAGNANVTQVPPTDVAWLTPGALAEATTLAIARGDEEITATTFDLSMGPQPVSMTMTRQAEEDIEVFGRVVPAIRWVTVTSALPGMQITQWSDSAGNPIRQQVPLMPGMAFEMLLADEQLALAEVEAPELLAASLITPNVAIANPRQLSRGVYDISSPGLRESIGDTIPNDAYQRSEWIDADTLRITIDLTQRITHENAEIDDAYLAATGMLNHEDSAVQELTNSVLVNEHVAVADGVVITSPIAMNLRSFVQQHIETKDLSVGFASASEVARTGQGDCTEHACLLAAMLRGAGIPSRTVTGIVYADQFVGNRNIFGFHMWAQAWIATGEHSGYWLDLDAAFPGNIDHFDATHIALSTSAMADGETFNAMVSMLPLMQGMQIQVVEQQIAQ